MAYVLNLHAEFGRVNIVGGTYRVRKSSFPMVLNSWHTLSRTYALPVNAEKKVWDQFADSAYVGASFPRPFSLQKQIKKTALLSSVEPNVGYNSDVSPFAEEKHY